MSDMIEEIVEGYRLSPQQRRLWHLMRHSGAHAFRCSLRVSLRGKVDAERLRRAWQRVVTRHESLRTTFRRVAGMELPVQVISEEAASTGEYVEVECREGCPLAAEGCAEAGQEWARLQEQRLDVESGPVWRVRAVRCGGERWELIVNASGLCADVRTLCNMVDEWARCYQLELLDSQPDADADTTEDPVQYADFSEWQHEIMESEEAEQARAGWEAGSEAAASVRLAHERGGDESGEYAPLWVGAKVSGQIVERLRAAARQSGAELNDVLEAAWRLLLWRLSGEGEVALSRYFDGRRIKHLQGAFGLFAKYLPIHCHLAATYQFSEIVRQVRDVVANTAALQDFLTPENATGADASDANSQASSVGFDYESLPGATQAVGISFTISRLYSCTERFKLRLSVLETGGALHCELHYDPSVYATETVERWAASFVTLLESVAVQPHALIGNLETIGERERRLLLAEWNDTESISESERCFQQLFEEQAERTPDVSAVAFGEHQLSYRDLNRRANQLARYLRRQGVGPEVLVGICLERSAEAIVSLLGVLKAGGAYVPLDADQPPSRLSRMITEAGALVLTQQSLLGRLADAVKTQVICIDAGAEAIAAESTENPGNNSRADNLAYVIYTSGSTGLPKGVMVQHRSVVNLHNALRRVVYEHIPPHSRISLNAPLSFDASVKQLVQLLAGHTLHIVPNEIRSDGEPLLEWLREQRITVFDSTPSQLRLLIDAGLSAAPSAASELRAVLVGGEAITDTLWAELSASTTTRYYNVYGPTECTVDAAVCEVSGPCASETPNIGRPITNARLYVLDATGRLLPAGVAGELYIGGAGVGRGYLTRPDLTAEKFVPDPFSAAPGARLYRTGDVVRYLADGKVEYVGRADYQVKVRGFRIELGEIESALRGHTAVRDCVVVTRDDESGSKRLVAYAVAARPSLNGHESNGKAHAPETAAALSPQASSSSTHAPAANADAAKSLTDELRSHLREQLPDYMMPSSIVLLDELPLTRHGKVDRSALPAPESLAGQFSEQSVEALPRTPYEELVAGVWEDVLGVGSIGREDNFFELGGHSLLATQILSRIRDVFQVNIPLRALFEQPTVETFAAGVERALEAESQLAPAPLLPAPRDGELPLSFAQQRLWFLDQLEPGRPFYNVPIALRLDGHLDVPVLGRTLDEVVRRHEVLRTTFVNHNGSALQRVSPSLRLPLPVVDLSALDTAERESATRLLAHKEARLSFDLSAGPLLRVTLLRLSNEEHVALFTTHHIVSDGWSIGVLVREVAALYAAFAEGQESPLAELPIQYADYAVWQREHLQGEVLEQQLDYWRKRLAGAPATLELPMARPRPRVQTYRGASYKFEFDTELAAGLRALSRREGVTVFMTLLAGWQALLARYTGQDDVVVGTAVANRTRRETEELIGFFINTLVLRTDMSGEPHFTELLRRVREVCLGAYAHQEVPFERLVEELRPERSLSHSPLFQVAFGLNNAPRVELQLPGLQLSAVEVEDEEVRFDLTLWVAESPEGLRGRWTYRTELFDAETIRRMTAHWEMLLRSIVASPDAPLSSLEMYTEEERVQRELEGKARTESNYKKFLSVKPEAIRITKSEPQPGMN